MVHGDRRLEVNCKRKNCTRLATQGIYCDEHFDEVTGSRGGPGVHLPRVDVGAGNEDSDEAAEEEEEEE